MSKLKLKPVELRCRQSEKYRFVRGVAVVPRHAYRREVVKISLKESKELRGEE